MDISRDSRLNGQVYRYGTNCPDRAYPIVISTKSRFADFGYLHESPRVMVVSRRSSRMNSDFSLRNIRRQLDQTWIIILFACLYLVSQITILMIIGPIEDAFLKLQMTGTSVTDYVSVFSTWRSSGDMALYQAHFILDDVHWIWYAVLLTALLSRLFNRLEISPAHNWFLLLPLASGLLDWYENRLQHVFLSSTDFSTIINQLPHLFLTRHLPPSYLTSGTIPISRSNHLP